MNDMNRHYASFGGALQAPEPIDPRMISKDIEERDAIPERIRFEGLVTKVLSDRCDYELRGGITNDHWVNLTQLAADYVRDQVDVVKDMIGPVEELPTQDKTSVVDAINELSEDIDAIKNPVHRYWYFPGGDALSWEAVFGIADILRAEDIGTCLWLRADGFCGARTRIGYVKNFVDGQTYHIRAGICGNSRGMEGTIAGFEFWKMERQIDNHNIVYQTTSAVTDENHGFTETDVEFTFHAADFADGDGSVYLCIFNSTGVAGSNLFIRSVELVEKSDVVGPLSDLKTADKANAVSAINEMHDAIDNDIKPLLHSHANKDVLDKLTQAVITNSHTHSNKTVLDGITINQITNWNGAYDHSQKTDNPHKVSKAQVGLGNADNTADKDKPVSAPQQSAIEFSQTAGLEAFRQVRLNQESTAAELQAEAKAREDGDAKALADAKSYTNTQITEAVHMSGDAGVMMSPLGGLPEGTDIGGTDIRELLKKLLIKYVAPVVTLTATQSGGGVYELGTKISPVFTVTVTKKSRSITAMGIYNGSSLLPSTLKLQPDGGSQAGVTLTHPITANASLKARAEDGEGTGESAAIGYTFVDPFYYGAVSSAPTDSAGVRALTKLVQTKGAKTVSHTATVEAAKFCFAYPASYGPLTKIIDQNGFDNTADYDKSAVNVTNAAGSEVSYSVYTYKNNVSPGTMKMTYNF